MRCDCPRRSHQPPKGSSFTVSPKPDLNNPGSLISLPVAIIRAAAKHLFVPLSRPDRCFGHLDDASWLWANTKGPRRFTWMRKRIPPLPDEQTQRQTNGGVGDPIIERGFHVYQTIREHCAKLDRPLNNSSRILDFGCGWGRILRLFLRDAPPQHLYGVDTNESRLAFCRESIPGVRLALSSALPPLDLPSGHFDLIYLNSVFSHLSEESHLAWLAEFHRLLVPGGVLAATTWPRNFIKRCDAARHQPDSSRASVIPLAKFFLPNKQPWLERYDAGEFCFSQDPAWQTDKVKEWRKQYGSACIPEPYVQSHWAPDFRLRVYSDHQQTGFGQNLIVATRQ